MRDTSNKRSGKLSHQCKTYCNLSLGLPALMMRWASPLRWGRLKKKKLSESIFFFKTWSWAGRLCLEEIWCLEKGWACTGGVSWPGQERKREAGKDEPWSGPARPGSHDSGGAGGSPWFGSCPKNSLIMKPRCGGPGTCDRRIDLLAGGLAWS